MRYLAVGLIIAVVVVLALGPLVLGRRQTARRSGRPIETSGLVPIGIVVALLAAGLAALSFAIRPGVIVLAAAGLAVALAAAILLQARDQRAPGGGLPKVPMFLFVVLGGLMAAVGVAAAVELLGPAAG